MHSDGTVEAKEPATADNLFDDCKQFTMHSPPQLRALMEFSIENEASLAFACNTRTDGTT